MSTDSGRLGWVRAHPLTTFFVLAYVFSWSAWLAGSATSGVDPILSATLDTMAPYGPATAAIALAGALRPVGTRVEWSWRRWAAAGLTAVVAAWSSKGLWGAALRGAHPLADVGAALLLTALPVALVCCAWSRRDGVRELLAPLLRWRERWFWWAVAILLPPVVGLAGWWLSALLAPDGEFPRHGGWPGVGVTLLGVFAATALYGGPLGEEVGWRGYAMPRLQARHSPAVASLLLGLLWGLWHLPLHLRGFYDASMGGGLTGLLVRVISGVGLSIIFTWMYNRTRGNLLLAVLLHTSVNNSSGYWLPSTAGATIVMALVVVALIVADKMHHRLPVSGTAVRSS